VVVSLTDTGREMTAVGNLAGVQPGESLRMTGRWTKHPKFGEQFQVESFLAVAPASLVGIERYLGSGLVPGIGKELASRLVSRFGERTLEVIDEQPAKLREVEGIGAVRAERIVQSWRKQREIRNVMIFLQSCGVSTALATRIYGRYGGRSREILGANPWQLAADVQGFGFRTADAIAQRLGVAPGSPHRAEAGILHALEQRAEEGHTWAPREALAVEAAKLLALEPAACAEAIDSLVSRKAVAAEKGECRQERPGECRQERPGECRQERPGEEGSGLVSLPRLARAETEAAQALARLGKSTEYGGAAKAPAAAARMPDRRGAGEELTGYEGKAGIVLSSLQREAVLRALEEKLLVITGGPGTGKTTLITAIVRILSRRGARVALCAPTGRAAKRMAEATGSEAKTIHRLLEWSPQAGAFHRNGSSRLASDAVIVDETSMIDIVLFAQLLDAIPSHARLVLVGDSDQLPSVGPGNVLADLIASGSVPVVRLTEIFRQAGASSIVVNAHRINAGHMPNPSRQESDDFFFIEREEPEAILATVRELVTTRIPRRFALDARKDVQVLTPMRKGLLGVDGMNKELQALLNPSGPSVLRGGTEFRTGDRVMQTRNNYELGVFNGDVGEVVEVAEASREIAVRFDERTLRYEWSDLEQLDLSYACSIHKSQGSEFPAVVIVLHTQHFVLLRRNLLYTAVTRGRKLAVLVGSRRALAMAVKNAGTAERCTRLSPRLASYLP
jgi:exodeoxyribonuclease V alpha subunit